MAYPEKVVACGPYLFLTQVIHEKTNNYGVYKCVRHFCDVYIALSLNDRNACVLRQIRVDVVFLAFFHKVDE